MIKKKGIRILVLLFIISIVLPYIYVTFQIILEKNDQVIMNSFYTKDGYIYEEATGEKYSIEKFTHPNGKFESLFSEPIIYRLNGIIYEFYLKNIENPIIKFNIGRTEYSFIDDNIDIILKKLNGWWPLGRETIVCPLPSGDCFYTPISITNMQGYTLLIMEPGPGSSKDASNISMWVESEGKWVQANFYFPDGKLVNSINGYARRHANLTGAFDECIGDMEICVFEVDRFIVYNIIFKNSQFVLTATDTYFDELPDNWKF